PVSGRWRGAAPLLAILALVVGLGAIGGGNGSAGPPLDPTSTSPDGAKALALLLDQLGPGIDQVTGPPVAATTGAHGIALVLQDRLDAAGDRQLADWVRRGGTLVAADPDLVLNFAAPAREPGPGGLVGVKGTLVADCSLAVVRGVETIDLAGGVALRSPPGSTGCFHTPDGGAFMVVQPLGAGQLVLLGGPFLWTNANLGHRDNSVLAANLLAPAANGPRVQWIVGPRAGGGHKSLLQLMAPRVKEGLVELGIALVLLALWRARRLGRPIVETPVVELPGSELVVAVGNLLHQGGRFDDAAAIFRATVRRGNTHQLRVSPQASTDAMADVVAARTGLDRNMILATVVGPPPTSEAELVTLAGNADAIRQEMTRAR
ncbi:MAG: hypothetical protein QOF20_539, partial [Acidimicrobiaceae bacterium]|nr:hypothetical protein [Acidimicrobiaceae bacterium]